MNNFNSPQVSPEKLRKRFDKNSELLTSALAVACLIGAGAQGAQAQGNDVIVLPSVDVETTAVAPKKVQKARKAVKRSAVKSRAAADAKAAAERAAAEQAAAELAAAQAAAAAKASAGSNPNADPDAPFKVDRLTGSKFPVKTLDTARTVYTISKEVLETTNTTSVRALARSTPGISLGFGEGGNAFGDNIYIRGFKANNDIFMDGMRDSGVGVRENFMTEQVEVFKGPSSTIGGRGTTGGALNIASKKPQAQDFTEVVTTLGNAGLRRVTLDVNKAVSDQLQFRVGAMMQDSGVAGRDYLKDNRNGLSAAVKYTPTDNFTLSANAYHVEINKTPDWGVPYSSADGVAVPELGISRNTFYGVRGRDFQDAIQDVGVIKAEWDLGNNLKLSNTFRASKSLNDYILSAPEGFSDNGSTDPADWTTGLAFKSQYQTINSFANVTELTGEADWGGVHHFFTVGASIDQDDVSKDGYTGLTSESYLPPAGSRGCTVSVVNPDPIAEGCWSGETPTLSGNPTSTLIKTKSIYALDTIEISPQWKVNGGVRVDWYDISRSGVDRNDVAYSLSRSDTMVNWNAGVTYKPAQNMSVYAAASTSSNPMGQEIGAGGGFYGGLDANGSLLAPEKNTSFELGVKYEHNRNLLLSAALFQTTKSNAREDSGGRGTPQVTTAVGQYTIRGLELGFAGKVTDRLSIFGGAVLMTSEIEKSVDAAAVGQSFPNIATQQFNLLATYDVTDKLMLGAQVNYGGKVKLGSLSPNGNELPSYLTLDLVGEYEIAKNTALKFAVKNVTDKTYYDAGYRSGSPFVYVAPGRELSISLAMKF